ncbi:MAG: outer membrane protein assembly factor BamE [Pseudomonadota bacterium]|jgi:outer membrane protein assembly factor BamE|nr:outer membrane protein assembly factor BamE [Gammaproteobacteria bacterium]MEC9358009.1 outer membrane protein assembly factor BamE [Pseudomonadota bacterium]
MRLLLIVLSAAALISGCQIVYKLPTRQGNVIEQKQLDQLRLGMNREQVEYLLGSPIATDPFRDDRWDYLGYYKSPRGDVSKRIVTLHFEGELLAQMEGIADPNSKDKALENPDVETILQQEKKDKQQTESRETGVILTPEGQ